MEHEMGDAAQERLVQLFARIVPKQQFDLNVADNRALVDASAALVEQSKALRETARDLVQDSRDRREFLHESRLQIYASCERLRG
jgi:hypothetical protein